MYVTQVEVKWLQAKVITEGAILLALFSVFLFISLYIIGLGMITVFLLPLPFIIFTVRNGYQKAVVLFIAALLLSFVIGSVFTIFSALLFATTGIVIGELFRCKKGYYQVLLAGSMTFLIGSVLMYAISVWLFKMDIIKEGLNSVDKSVDMAINIISGLGQQPDEKVIESLKSMVDMIQYLIPTAFIFSAFIFTIITLFFSKHVLKRLKLSLGPWPTFARLTLPRSLLWYYLLMMILTFFNLEEGSFFFTAVLNLFYILQILMIVQGFSFLFYYCGYKGYQKTIPIVITILSLLIPFLLYIIRILGIIDLGFDIRKRLTNDR